MAGSPGEGSICRHSAGPTMDSGVGSESLLKGNGKSGVYDETGDWV